MSDAKDLCYSIFERMDLLIQKKLGNMVLVKLYKTIILPYFHWGIKSTSDEDIKENLGLENKINSCLSSLVCLCRLARRNNYWLINLSLFFDGKIKLLWNIWIKN